MELYVICSPDKYELPMIVAESVVECSRFCGRSVTSLYHDICRGGSGLRTGYKIEKVIVEDDD